MENRLIRCVKWAVSDPLFTIQSKQLLNEVAQILFSHKSQDIWIKCFIYRDEGGGGSRWKHKK